MKGLANVKVLIGVVNILGSNIGPEHEAVQIFSPSSSSLISLCEFNSDAKIQLETKKRTLKETLQKQSSDLIQKAVKRAKKAATVLLISSLQTVETSFVSSFQCYEGIFNLDLDKVDAFAITLQITLHSNYVLISFSIHQKFVLLGLFVSICLQCDMLIYSTCLSLSILLFQSKYLFFIHFSVHPHIFFSHLPAHSVFFTP